MKSVTITVEETVTYVRTYDIVLPESTDISSPASFDWDKLWKEGDILEVHFLSEESVELQGILSSVKQVKSEDGKIIYSIME